MSGTHQQMLSAHQRTASTGSSEWEYLDEEHQSVTSFSSAEEDREALIIFDVPSRRIQQHQQSIPPQPGHLPSSPSSGTSISAMNNSGIDATGLRLGITSAASEAMHFSNGGHFGGLESASLASGELSDDLIPMEQRLIERIERLSHELSESHAQNKRLTLQNDLLSGENTNLKNALKQFQHGGGSGGRNNMQNNDTLIEVLRANKTAGVAAMTSMCLLAALLRRRAGLGPIAIAGALASVVMWLNANPGGESDVEPHALNDAEEQGMTDTQVKQLAKEEFARRQVIVESTHAQ
jgi:hypothetical protein